MQRQKEVPPRSAIAQAGQGNQQPRKPRQAARLHQTQQPVAYSIADSADALSPEEYSPASHLWDGARAALTRATLERATLERWAARLESRATRLARDVSALSRTFSVGDPLSGATTRTALRATDVAWLLCDVVAMLRDMERAHSAQGEQGEQTAQGAGREIA